MAVIDLGLKHSLLRELSLRKINSVVLPYNASIYDIINIRADGIIFSNGPSNPNELKKDLAPIFERFYGKLPILGIGLGFLAISDYLNLETFELQPPYNGSNFPVIDQQNHRIWQTAMNLGELVFPENITLGFSRVYYDLKSDLLAGYVLEKDKCIATAFNPEGSPGNFDADSIYDQFVRMMG